MGPRLEERGRLGMRGGKQHGRFASMGPRLEERGRASRCNCLLMGLLQAAGRGVGSERGGGCARWLCEIDVTIELPKSSRGGRGLLTTAARGGRCAWDEGDESVHGAWPWWEFI